MAIQDPCTRCLCAAVTAIETVTAPGILSVFNAIAMRRSQDALEGGKIPVQLITVLSFLVVDRLLGQLWHLK